MSQSGNEAALQGDFAVGEKIGGGSAGVVSLAESPNHSQQIVVKVLHPELCLDRDAVGRYFAEAKKATSTGDIGIVPALDMGHTAGGRAFVASELVNGESLEARLVMRGTIDSAEVVDLAEQICSTLQTAHKMGLSHRALKPGNIMLIGDPFMPSGERVRITDFGIAAVREVAKGKLDISQDVAYLSPEQCFSSDRVDHRSDQYALGCVLYRALNGRPPFVGNTGEVMTAHITKAPSPVFDASVPKPLVQFIMRLLQKSAENRFSSMAVALGALEEVKAAVGMEPGALAVRPKASLPPPIRTSPAALPPPPGYPPPPIASTAMPMNTDIVPPELADTLMVGQMAAQVEAEREVALPLPFVPPTPPEPPPLPKPPSASPPPPPTGRVVSSPPVCEPPGVSQSPATGPTVPPAAAAPVPAAPPAPPAPVAGASVQQMSSAAGDDEIAAAVIGAQAAAAIDALDREGPPVVAPAPTIGVAQSSRMAHGSVAPRDVVGQRRRSGTDAPDLRPRKGLARMLLIGVAAAATACAGVALALAMKGSSDSANKEAVQEQSQDTKKTAGAADKPATAKKDDRVVVPIASAPTAAEEPATGQPEPEGGPALRANGAVDRPVGLVALVIESDPPGAAVVRQRDGVRLGVTPFRYESEPAAGVTAFRIEKDGYRAVDVSMPSDRDGIREVLLLPGSGATQAARSAGPAVTNVARPKTPVVEDTPPAKVAEEPKAVAKQAPRPVSKRSRPATSDAPAKKKAPTKSGQAAGSSSSRATVGYGGSDIPFE